MAPYRKWFFLLLFYMIFQMPRLPTKRKRQPPKHLDQYVSVSSHQSPPDPAPSPDVSNNTIDPSIVSAITSSVMTQIRSELRQLTSSSNSNSQATPVTSPAAAGEPPHEAPPASSSSTQDSVNNDNVLPGLLSSTLDKMMEGESTLHHSSSSTFQSAATPLGASHPLKIKAKIWAGEYVDLGSLISPPNSDNYTVTLSQQENQPQVSVSSQHSKRNITSISMWTDAFLVYMGILTQRFPDLAPNLCKYITVIRDLATKTHSASWLQYDIEFRRFKHYNQDLSRGAIHWELYMSCLATSTGKLPNTFRQDQTQTAPRSKAKGPSKLVPKGYCWSFHK